MMSPEYLVVPESIKVLKKMMGTCQKAIVVGLKGLPLTESGILDNILEQNKNLDFKLIERIGKFFFTV